MISPEVSIRFHCVLILLNFFAMACFAAVADFQAKWDIGPSALSGYAVVISVAGIFLSLFMIYIPFTQLMHTLAGVRAVVFAAFLTFMYLLTALLTTISAFTEPGCISPMMDPHALENGALFTNGLPGWCTTKKAGAIFFLFVFTLWAVALVAIYVQISNDRLAPPQVEDPRPTEQLPQETDPEKPPDPHVEPHWQVVVPSADVQRPTFHCNVCLETYAVDDIVRVDLCEHAFCRECLRNYISSKLKDRHFPIFCPTCMTEESTQDHSAINILLAQQVGIAKEECEIWSDLEMAALAIEIHCPGCNRMVSVPRQEYEETSTITCPLPNCNHRWCKTCRHAVPIGDAMHSCDGLAELDGLVKNRGWRRCPGPGCNTIIQKARGCHHMKCIVSGCNTHFCYRCGDLIVRSALPDVVNTGVRRHYRACQMFEDDD